MKVPFPRFFAHLFVVLDRHKMLAWLIAVGVALAAFVSVYNEKPFLSYSNTPFPVGHLVDGEVVPVGPIKAGEIVPLVVIRCNNTSRDMVYPIARTVERVDNREQIMLDNSIVQIPPGCETGESRLNRVPLTTPPGRYRILGLSPVPTSFRVINVPWSSEEFEVIQ